MKQFFRSLICLVLILALLPTAYAADGGAVSSNIDDHFYINAGRFYHPIYSNLAWENGQYVRAEAIGNALVVEYYDQNLKYLSGKTIDLELPIFGGVRMDTDYNFVVVGQNNPNEDDSCEVFRIIRYTKDWEKVDHASLFGANTYIPFDAGSLRFDRSGDMLYIRTAHEMYASSDGLHHQANVMIALRVSDMTVTDELTEVLNRNYGYISHSFNQFVRVDGDTLLAVDHGDALPRSVVLIKYGKKAGEEQFYGRVSYVNALPIVDSTYHYNDTGVSVGGFECSSTDYLIAGSSYDQQEPTDLMYAHRNIFVTATPKDDFTDEGTDIHWLTSYAEGDQVTVSPPHLVKVDSDRFFLTWTEDDVLHYCFLDGHGQLDGEIHSGDGALSDCVPIVADDRIIWYVTDYSAPVFYQIDLNDPGSVTIPHTHAYTYSVKTAPTTASAGLLVGQCSSCDHTDEVRLPILSEVDYDYAVLTAPGHNTAGLARYTWKNTAYGVWSFDVTLPACTHSYTSVTTQPTCTTGGSTVYTCSICGHSYTEYTDPLGHDVVTDAGYPATCTSDGLTDGSHCGRCGVVLTQQTIIPATGHRWDEGTITKEPTAEESGEVRYTCLNCGEVRLETLPPHVHDYTDTQVVAPTCEADGYTLHICAGCGHSYADSYTPALGHDWHGLDCRRCDATRKNPFTDTDPYQFYFAPILWAVENGITNGMTPTTFEPGTTCTRGQVVTFLWRAAGKPEPKSTDHPFEDVTEDYYYKAMLWAVEKGITNGMSPTTFEPGTTCTRGQVVTFLWRFAGKPDPKSTNHPFEDVTEDYYYDAMLWAVEKGITNGMTPTTFEPGTTCTRAQVVTFLYRAFA